MRRILVLLTIPAVVFAAGVAGLAAVRAGRVPLPVANAPLVGAAASTTVTPANDLAQTLAEPSPAPAATPAPQPVPTLHSMLVGSLTRQWYQVAPANGITSSTPILMVLHGQEATALGEITRDDLTPLVAQAEAELIYPQGIGDSWNAGGCCGEAAADNVDDVGFIQTLVQAVDPGLTNPIYLVGYSNGGRLAYTIACEDPTLVDAYAIVDAVPEPGCTPSRPITLLQVDGTDDPDIAYLPGEQDTEGGDPATTWVAQMRQVDGCAPTPTSVDTGTLVTATYSGCVAGVRFVFATYEGATHAWPAGSATTPSAAMTIWSFVDAASIWIQTLDSSGQGLGGASYELVGPSGVFEVPTPAGVPTSVPAACTATTVGCVDILVDLSPGTYTLREVMTPAPSTASPGGYAPCDGGDSCQGESAQVVVLSNGTIAAVVSNTDPNGSISSTNQVAGTAASPIVFTDSALGATGCASDTTGIDGADVGSCALPAGTTSSSSSPCGAYPWSCSIYDAYERVIGNLYLDDLGREAQLSEIAYWDGLIAGGTGAGQVANDILQSREHDTSLVNADYEQMLGRAADAGGSAYWTGVLDNGASNEEVLASLAASNEYFADHGSSDSGYVVALYQSILDATIPASDPGVTYWVGHLQAGASLESVAAAILASNQYHGGQISTWYMNDLGRPPAATEVAYWTSVLDSGATDATVEASILGSAEHIAYIWNDAPSSNTNY